MSRACDYWGLGLTRDPYLLLAIQAYKREPVTLKQLARMLGIGEKAFSKLVKQFHTTPSVAGATEL